MADSWRDRALLAEQECLTLRWLVDFSTKLLTARGISMAEVRELAETYARQCDVSREAHERLEVYARRQSELVNAARAWLYATASEEGTIGGSGAKGRFIEALKAYDLAMEAERRG